MLFGLVTVHMNHWMHHWGSFLLELVQEENSDHNDCTYTREVFPYVENTAVKGFVLLS